LIITPNLKKTRSAAQHIDKISPRAAVLLAMSRIFLEH